jgi:hypothetical protein
MPGPQSSLSRSKLPPTTIPVVTCRPQAMRLLLEAAPVTSAAPQILPLQEHTPQPIKGRWGVLPSLLDQVLIDTVGMNPVQLVMTLSDLQAQQRVTGLLPTLLFCPTSYRTRVLVALSNLRSLILAEQTPLTSIITAVHWSHAVRFYPQYQFWLATRPPQHDAETHSELVPLLAALSQAATLEEASCWLGVSRRTTYAVLRRISVPLGVADGSARRQPREWFDAIMAALEQHTPR